MYVPPEIAFDRAIKSKFPERLRASYAGKRSVDPERDIILSDVQALINEMYRTNSERLLDGDGRHPWLHFDFIEGSAVNALAFNEGQYSFVGLTVPLVDEFQQLASRLVESRNVLQIFDMTDAGQERIGDLWTALFATMLNFVAFHELGHHFCGHCPADGTSVSQVLEEYPISQGASSADILERQAAELDADAYAIRTLAENFITGAARPEILSMLGRTSDQEDDAQPLATIVLAAGTFFFHRQRLAGNVGAFTHGDHPPAVVRLQRGMEVLHRWLLLNRPNSAEWTLGAEYTRVMDAGTRALGNDAAGEIWDTVTSQATSVQGQEYLSMLEIAGDRLRERLRPRMWRYDDGIN